jgi:ComF family protein
MAITDFLFPRRCFGCGYIGIYICPSCIKRLSVVISQECFYCGKKSLYGLTHPACKRKSGVDGYTHLFYYNNTLKKIVKGIKYSLVSSAKRDLQYLIGRYGAENLLFYKKIPPLFIHPIPLSSGKERTRGFNQVNFITSSLSYLLEKPTICVLEKKKTLPQAQMIGRAARQKNIKGAFLAKKGLIFPKEILLIDDVVTTGGTIKEATKALKQKGVRRVYVFSVAKG